MNHMSVDAVIFKEDFAKINIANDFENSAVNKMSKLIVQFFHHLCF